MMHTAASLLCYCGCALRCCVSLLESVQQKWMKVRYFSCCLIYLNVWVKWSWKDLNINIYFMRWIWMETLIFYTFFSLKILYLKLFSGNPNLPGNNICTHYPSASMRGGMEAINLWLWCDVKKAQIVLIVTFKSSHLLCTAGSGISYLPLHKT